jgi:hypothetical protein
MTLNFPANPSDGETYSGYTWVASDGYWRKERARLAALATSLEDVVITDPSSGQALTYDGSEWVNATPATTVDSLTDTTIDTPSEGQILVFDESESSWVNQTPPESALSALSDVSLTDPAVEETLVYNGTEWSNQKVSTGFENYFLMMGA